MLQIWQNWLSDQGLSSLGDWVEKGKNWKKTEEKGKKKYSMVASWGSD